ncbi:hypothetical protein ACEWY4_012272 [Coilia grayii]|uniref:histone acetyltransferase n=1 Tax=Coilia grayii TaxID=363190 RepID=A0ABD1K012_9TELE
MSEFWLTLILFGGRIRIPLENQQVICTRRTRSTIESAHPAKKPWSSTETEDLKQDKDQSHEHKLEKAAMGPDDLIKGQDAATAQKAAEMRQQSAQRSIPSLLHAVQCRASNCSLPSCQKMKRALQHTTVCKDNTSGGCRRCNKLIALCRDHALHCQENKCPVPFCASIKQTMQQHLLQQKLQELQKLQVLVARQRLQQRVYRIQRMARMRAVSGPAAG